MLQLADVYRYLLENRDDNLTSLKKELDFLEQYIFLHKIRFKNSLNITIVNQSDDELIFYKKIPVLSLETLVENAIKHNEITKSNPLNIEVEINNTHVTVTNNYSPKKKEHIEGHKIGFMVDSGAGVSVIDKNSFGELQNKAPIKLYRIL